MAKLVPTNASGLLQGCKTKKCKINLPIDAENIGPFVKINIIGLGNETITVGNKSCPGCNPQHTAIIKSFEYGMSDGQVLKFVIQDQAGGSFSKVFKALNTDFCELTTNYQAVATWGWTGTTCDERIIIKESEPITFLISSITTNMSGGKIEYEVEGTDLFRGIMQSRAFRTIGDQDNFVTLKTAIRQLFAGPPEPLITDIKFWRRKPDGTVDKKEWEFEDEPAAYWHPANRNKISVAIEWIRPYLSDQGRGVIDYTWNSGNGTPSIIFWEDLTGKNVTCSALGTYIVNGGAFSPVISFQPKFQWNYTNAARSGGANSGASSKAADLKESRGSLADGLDCKKGAGVQIGSSMADHEHVIINRLANSGEKNMKAIAGQGKTNAPFVSGASGQPVTADLVIQGDPAISTTEVVYKNHVSLIVVNPFYLSGGQFAGDGISESSNGKCPDWTIGPPCNELGSNSKWMVMGVNHSISQGSYLTTLTLFLDVPGVDKPDWPLGQDGISK